MDENYDVIVLGTGLTECVLSGILSVEGKKVLHIDRQDFYGGESASLNLSQLYSKFKPSSQKPDNIGGRDRDWCVDLIPKFLMANGELTNILVHTEVTKYIEFKSIGGSYVYRSGRISKVPSNEMEALRSSLMGIFEKRRMKRFMEFVAAYDENDASTHKSMDLDKNTMDEVYTYFGLEKGTKDFIGHAMALWATDDYMSEPARPTIERIILYVQSVARYGKSPYIYPLYGLGELPQGFARLSAIYGGTYMLGTPIDEVLYDENKKFAGVVTKEGTAKAPIVIADPTYFPERVKKTGSKVIRAMCILDHPVPNTNDLDSVQIIIPQSQVGRKHDIYIAVLSDVHCVVPKGYYLAIVSTIVETDTPHVELEPAFKLLGSRLDTLMGLADLYEPADDGTESNIFISKSYDSSSHFESTTDDIKDLYFRITGKPLELKKRSTDEDLEGL
ncbi:putative rab GDP-dissociation inhibitor [Clavispora lusitaniae]|uniref:Rab GDP dissociation inhibitor n=2 Tax=Clavispora lusitaniae TaxID=36911 RepID=A0AA91Q1X3_CLALS|nr:Rab GDP dissociation inhibitor alpha [Clavispora lusitaniae]KAF7580648.1 Rab GDP-dissociation inhibitor [Clavispora lusitaniae]OVF09465.1 putative Rab GDP dissociation inhibitor [Clavispora lusitaniae]QFZ30532.1 putative rab GDP-dissociation inhibitor [Clavispora lusitaniae]QFZ36194.1 putative rab GDP-dissociation inhibitor [Clavispora lusitaniae]